MDSTRASLPICGKPVENLLISCGKLRYTMTRCEPHQRFPQLFHRISTAFPQALWKTSPGGRKP